VDPDQNPTRSGLEDTLLPWIRHHNLPVPRLNAFLNGYEVDAYFPQHNLILELDSWEYHHARDSFASDSERDAHHLAHGTPTVRIIPERLNDAESRRLRHILSVGR
jgi:very-short-patch-repair endonuclease